MADEKKIIEISVDNDAAIQEIIRLREETAKLKDTEGLTQEQIEANRIATQEYNQQIRALQGEVKNSIRTDREKQGSLNQMKAEIANLTKEYNALSKEEREGAKGTELRDKIRGLSDDLKDNEKAIGDNRRNVGNYQDALENLPGRLGDASKGVKGLSAQFKAMLANPVVAVIAAIAGVIMGLVAVFRKVVDVAKSNEEQSEKLAIAMMPLRVLGDAITKVFEGLAEVYIKVAGTVATLITGFTDYIGLTKDATEATKEYIKVEQEKEALEDKMREANVLLAQGELKVAQLRAEVARKDLFSTQQRLDKNREAVEIERLMAGVRKENAEEELRIMEIEAARTKNSDEMNDKIVAARVKVINADRDYYQTIRRLETQTASLVQEIAADKAALQEANEKRRVEIAKQKAQADNEELINERAKQMQLDNIAIEAERKREQLKVKIRKEAATSPEALDELRQRAAIEMDAEYQLRATMYNGVFELQKYELEKQYAQQIAAAEKVGADTTNITALYERAKTEIQKEETSARLDLVAGLAGDIAQLFGEGTVAGKMAASAQTAINTYQAAMGAYANATPLLGPIGGFIAAGIATAAGIKAIKNIWAVKSGLPGDSNSASSSVRLTSVAPVTPDTTARIASPLTPIISPNGSAAITSGAATSISTGAADPLRIMQNMPAPIVTVKDIDIAQKRVKVTDSLAKV